MRSAWFLTLICCVALRKLVHLSVSLHACNKPCHTIPEKHHIHQHVYSCTASECMQYCISQVTSAWLPFSSPYAHCKQYWSHALTGTRVLGTFPQEVPRVVWVFRDTQNRDTLLCSKSEAPSLPLCASVLTVKWVSFSYTHFSLWKINNSLTGLFCFSLQVTVSCHHI